jgi:hypothetical protein
LPKRSFSPDFPLPPLPNPPIEGMEGEKGNYFLKIGAQIRNKSGKTDDNPDRQG